MRTPALTLTLIGMQVSLLEEWQVHREAIYLSVAQQAQVLQEGLTSVLELFRASVQDQAALEALVEQGITSESALLHTLAENLQATAMGKEALGMIDSTRTKTPCRAPCCRRRLFGTAPTASAAVYSALALSAGAIKGKFAGAGYRRCEGNTPVEG